MDSHWGTPNHRKRKRRRGPQKAPLPAHLTLESRLTGDVGFISEDLFVELFPSYASTQANASDGVDESVVVYAAIKPNLASSILNPDSVPWTVVPVKKSTASNSSKAELRSSLRFSPSSTVLQHFVSALQKASPNRSPAGYQSGVDVLILDVALLPLETIVVSIDEVALKNLENANNDFNHGLPRRRGSKSNGELYQTSSRESLLNGGKSDSEKQGGGHWEDAIRKALSSRKVIHAGDLLPLPLASHPISHVAPPPALVEFCEPVTQGFASRKTKVVVVSSAKASKRVLPAVRASYVIPNGVAEEEEDTSNEQFYSAAEEKSDSPAARIAGASTSLSSSTESEDAETSQDEDSDLSDSEGDTIGLDLPMLPTQASGAFSAFSSATPRPGQFGVNGIATPGSVVSAFSTSTVRGGSSRGRLFEAQTLLLPIPGEALHPKPSADEDEEARVFMDTTSLVKIGCFSGDWVKVEVSSENPLSALGSLGMSAFGSKENLEEWRTVKVYALPGQSTARPRYAIDRTGHRRSSISHSLSHFQKPALKVFLSPLLLSNLGNPSNLHVESLAPPQQNRSSARALPPKSRFNSSSMPPVAKEVTFMRLLTPIATEKSMDSSFHLGVRKFFETKNRIVKSGDLIGIAIDPELGRAVYQGTANEEEQAYEELISKLSTSEDGVQPLGSTEVVWFKIGSVISEPPQEPVDHDEEPSWGGVAVVKPGSTRMAQSGSEQGKIPDAMHNYWAYYLGAKRLPGSSEASDPSMPVINPPKTYISQTKRRLRELISAATSPQAIHLGLPPVAILLVSSQRHIGKAKAATDACLDLGLHSFVIDSYDIVNDAGGGGGDVKTAGLLEARAERAMTCGSRYTALLIRHIDVLTADRMTATLKKILEDSRAFIATTSDVESVPEAVRSLFTHEIEINAPDEGEREGLLRDIVQDAGIPVSSDVDFGSIALKTAALVAGDLVDVVDRATVARQERLEALVKTSNKEASVDHFQVNVRDIHIAGGEASRCVTRSDFDVAVEAARKNFADAIGAPKIPNVTWDDVGGLTHVKDAVMETIQLPLERPELFAKGMKKRSGILFYGPPGTGKTLLAKAIATEFSLNFFSVKGPELLNMYIGESEANVRRVFQRARDARPCVVFFDELDSVAPKRGNQGDSGGVMDRIVSQLLAELDGMSSGEDGSGGVFVIGATNRPDLLDQALLRPGRFDKMLYLGVSDTHEKQLTILEALSRKFALHPSLSLSRVSETLPFTYTGADLYALCSDAMLKAITRRATAVDVKVRNINGQRAAALPPQEPVTVAHFFNYLADEEDTEVVVEERDFADALDGLVPSVSAAELEHYERVRLVFERGEEKPGILVDRPKIKSPVLGNGKGKGKAPVSPTGNEDDEDDYLAHHAENLTLTEKVNGSIKGKGKAIVPVEADEGMGFGDASEGDEFLYGP